MRSFTKNVMFNVMVLFFVSIQTSQCTLIDMANGNEEESQVTAGKQSNASTNSSSLYSLLLLNGILSSSSSYSYSSVSPNCTSSSKSCTFKDGGYSESSLQCIDSAYIYSSLCSLCNIYSSSINNTQYSNLDCKGFGYTDGMKSSTYYNCFYNGTTSSSYQPCNATIKNNFWSSDKTAPEVTNTYPANTNSISIYTNILIYLSEEIDISTLSTANVLLKKSGVTVSSYTVSYNYGSNAIQIPYINASYNYFLSSASSYTVTVTTNVKDIAGNALKNEYTFSFTTQ
jgi:hypothetical protein